MHGFPIHHASSADPVSRTWPFVEDRDVATVGRDAEKIVFPQHCSCRSAMEGAAVENLRALGLAARRPLTGCSLSPRCRISLPSGGSRTILFDSWVSCHGRKSVWVKTR